MEYDIKLIKIAFTVFFACFVWLWYFQIVRIKATEAKTKSLEEKVQEILKKNEEAKPTTKTE